MKGVRKLCCASIGYCAAVFLSHYLLDGEKLYIVMLLPTIIAVASLLFRGRMRTRLMIIAIAAAVGFAHYYLHSDATIAKCEPYVGKEMTVSARVLDYPDKRDSCSLITVKLTDDSLPRVKALIADYSDERAELKPGDEIVAKLKLRSAHERYGEETDSNISKGIYLSASAPDGVEKTGRWKYSFLYFPKLIGSALHNEIGRLFPGDTAPFMKALLAGYKDDYYQNDKFYASMNMAGLAHVVAVSGMHVAFLIGVLLALLGRSKRSSVACIALIWAFVIMVGSPLSAVRSGIMMSLLLLAPVFGRENDNATTLSLALMLILFSNPFSAGSVALQLSFGSVAGMFLLAGPINDSISSHISPPRALRRVSDYVIVTFSSSLAVTVFTLPLMALHFGYVSLLAPLVNILCLWAISVLFIGGFAVCAVGLVLPGIATAAAWILSYLVRYIALAAEAVAKLPFSALYTQNKYALIWMISVYIIFGAFFVLKRVHKLSAMAPTAICAAMLVAVFALTGADMRRDGGTISVMDVGNGQCIAVTKGGSAVVIDCGSYGVMENAGSMTANYLRAAGHNDIDYLMLTHLHSDHASGVVRLLNLMRVKTLILPDNAEDTSANGILDEIKAAANDNGTSIVYITHDTSVAAGDIDLSIFQSSDKGSRSESGIMTRVSIGEYDMLVTGDVEKVVERELAENHDLRGIELLIVPHHGSKKSTSDELLTALGADTAVISTGYNNYGHPAPETIERLKRYGLDILRTDELGRIRLHISGD